MIRDVPSTYKIKIIITPLTTRKNKTRNHDHDLCARTAAAKKPQIEALHALKK